jgi:hypothetical protein
VERSGAAEITPAYQQNQQDALAADVFGLRAKGSGKGLPRIAGRRVEVRPRAL